MAEAEPEALPLDMARDDDSLSQQPAVVWCELQYFGRSANGGKTLATEMAEDLDAPDSATGKTRLIVACEGNQVQQARSLLTSRASVDVGTKDNQSPREYLLWPPPHALLCPLMQSCAKWQMRGCFSVPRCLNLTADRPPRAAPLIRSVRSMQVRLCGLGQPSHLCSCKY